MSTGGDVLSMLLPDGGWVIYGDDYDSIKWVESEPITKEEFEAGFAQYDAWKIQQDAESAAKRETALAKLAALGLDTDDLKALNL